MTAHERTNWRDQRISARHREWGQDCPAVDLDFLMCEYNHGLPVALVDYKHDCVGDVSVGHPTMKALTALANGYGRGPLPFFIAFYDPDEWWFRIKPMNAAAEKAYAPADRMLSERRYVRSLYVLRNATITAEVMRVLSTRKDVVPNENYHMGVR